MKKLISLLALAILVSSCGNKMTLLKRHYTKGYYLQHSKQEDKTASVKTTNVVTDKMAPTIVSFTKNEKAVAPVLSASLKINKEEKIIRKQSYRAELKKHITSQNNKANAWNISLTKATGFKEESKKGGNSDGNLILLVILAIIPLLSLVAMYIHDGHKVTTNFWVDLLLHFTVIGYAIFGLLVVFNVVDLS